MAERFYIAVKIHSCAIKTNFNRVCSWKALHVLGHSFDWQVKRIYHINKYDVCHNSLKASCAFAMHTQNFF